MKNLLLLLALAISISSCTSGTEATAPTADSLSAAVDSSKCDTVNCDTTCKTVDTTKH